jgi:hypothetical protein
MFSSFMDSVMVWGGAATVKANGREQVREQTESLQTRVAYREALVSLRAAQRHLARREGVRGADVNRVLAGEIEAAIREIHTVGTWEFDHESQGLSEVDRCQGKYGAALVCLAKAEAALAGALTGELPEVKGSSKAGGTLKRTLLHVRTAKWWVAPQAAPRYTQILVAR